MQTALKISALVVALFAGWCLAAFSGERGQSVHFISLPDVASVPRSGWGSPDSAYAAIPHRRTLFDADAVKMTDVDRKYLDLMFELIDEAIVVRVDAIRVLHQGENPSAHLAFYERLIQFTRQVTPPTGLNRYHHLILEALHEQESVFRQAHQREMLPGSLGDGWRDSELVQSSSNKLQRAYMILMRKFIGQSSETYDAFFDYHCALDFI